MHVVVIGAGIQGVVSAIELLRDGHAVTLLDPGQPGGEQAASYGNGGWLSTSSIIPVGTPGLPHPPTRRALPPGPPDESESDAGAVSEAMGNFLNMFG